MTLFCEKLCIASLTQKWKIMLPSCNLYSESRIVQSPNFVGNPQLWVTRQPLTVTSLTAIDSLCCHLQRKINIYWHYNYDNIWTQFGNSGTLWMRQLFGRKWNECSLEWQSNISFVLLWMHTFAAHCQFFQQSFHFVGNNFQN